MYLPVNVCWEHVCAVLLYSLFLCQKNHWDTAMPMFFLGPDREFSKWNECTSNLTLAVEEHLVGLVAAKLTHNWYFLEIYQPF